MRKLFYLTTLLLGFVIAFSFIFWQKSNTDSSLLQVEILPSPSPEAFTLGFAGEIILARNVASKINQYKDYKFPFYKVVDLTSGADLFFATLEAPLSGENVPCGKDCMRFIGDEQGIEGLIFAGIDVVSLAANHIMDGGEEALAKTLTILDKNGIAHTGAGLTSEEARKPVVQEIKGVKMGFVAYNDIYPKENTATVENLIKEIADLKKIVDLVIVAFHWGTEYTAYPSFYQKELAHKAIESGADLVIGDHPHWIQGIEFYQGRPIFYSVGNFVFDQMWSIQTRQGIIVLVTFEGEKLIKIELFPIQTEDFCQPSPLSGQEKEEIIERIFSISDPRSIEILKDFM